MKLLRLIANLGYGSRKEVRGLFREGRITDANGDVLYADDIRGHDDIRVDGEPLDPPQGIVIMMHKPLGVVCSHKGEGERVYDLLPERFTRRRPQISSIGRLDRDSSGLLLFTDDGQFLHRVISPRSHVPKRYRVRLERDLNGEEADLFAAGQLVLKGEDTPVGPAMLEVIDPRNARITIHEGRYHQVRRMFAAVGNHVQDLHREAIGGLMLDDLEPRAWRMLQASEMASIMAPNADTCDSSTETGSP